MALQQVAKFRTEHARPLLADVSGQTTGGSTFILWFKRKAGRTSTESFLLFQADDEVTPPGQFSLKLHIWNSATVCGHTG
jgi:hypothetical protein